jgi:hypothetical protein
MQNPREADEARDAPTLQYQSAAESDAPFAITVGVIGLRLLGIYLILQLLNLLSLVASIFWNPFQRSRFSSGPDWDTLVMWGSPHVLLAIAGAILVWRARPLAERMFRDLPTSTSTVRSTTVLAIVVVAIGIYLTVDALPLLLSELASFFRRNAGPGYPLPFDRSQYPQLITSAIRLLMGVLLCVFATRISGLWSSRLS